MRTESASDRSTDALALKGDLADRQGIDDRSPGSIDALDPFTDLPADRKPAVCLIGIRGHHFFGGRIYHRDTKAQRWRICPSTRIMLCLRSHCCFGHRSQTLRVYRIRGAHHKASAPAMRESFVDSWLTLKPNAWSRTIKPRF
jgi:hypothetical protein